MQVATIAPSRSKESDWAGLGFALTGKDIPQIDQAAQKLQEIAAQNGRSMFLITLDRQRRLDTRGADIFFAETSRLLDKGGHERVIFAALQELRSATTAHGVDIITHTLRAPLSKRQRTFWIWDPKGPSRDLIWTRTTGVRIQ